MIREAYKLGLKDELNLKLDRIIGSANFSKTLYFAETFYA